MRNCGRAQIFLERGRRNILQVDEARSDDHALDIECRLAGHGLENADIRKLAVTDANVSRCASLACAVDDRAIDEHHVLGERVPNEEKYAYQDDEPAHTELYFCRIIRRRGL